MDMQDIDTLRALLPTGRTLFPYFKDKYAFQLLRYALPAPMPVAELRRQPVARLLQKPVLRPALSSCGRQLDRQHLQLHAAPADGVQLHYALGLGRWGNASGPTLQTSRRGSNLVLQLNFDQAHNREFERLVAPHENLDPFNVAGHPSLKARGQQRRYTLAWARLDVDLEQGEALIEEVQTDWLRRATRVYEAAGTLDETRFRARFSRGFGGSREGVRRYYEQWLAPHRALWDEAMLAAALFFLREELGLSRIWMHSAASGACLKGIRNRLPPASLYSVLPERFCFQQDEGLPGFLSHPHVGRRLARAGAPRLYRFSL